MRMVSVGGQQLSSYRQSAGHAAVDVLRELALSLRGLRVLHLSATPYGGGVAELLRSQVPLLRDLGLAVDWKLIAGSDAFFAVTKAIHNGLQGADDPITDAQWDTFRSVSAQSAQQLDHAYDVIVVHDPQPVAIAQLAGRGRSLWVWRCHIDTSEPNPTVWQRLAPYLEDYDAAVFTHGGFVPPNFPVARIEIVPPAIDPESPKNIELPPRLARRVLGWIGVDLARPLVTQVSRFDPWKDPFGVIAAYRLVKEQVEDVQLALVGSMALDDPQGWGVYSDLERAVRDDPDLYLFTNLTGVGNIEVNAFQRLSRVVVQKSIREGFGLVVSETLWKGTPVVAGRAGGIPLQLREGAGGFLVDSVSECAERVIELLQSPDEAETLGSRGRDLVRERFLLPRLLGDELRLYAALLDRESPRHAGTGQAGIGGEARDPVCGMRIDDGGAALTAVSDSRTYAFCSPNCRHEFLRDTARFLRSDTGSISLAGGSPKHDQPGS
jgi:trehalose synthase